VKSEKVVPLPLALWAMGIVCAVASAQPAPSSPSTQPVGNGGRDPSLPADLNSPVIRTLPPARSIKKLQAAPLYSFRERDVDAYLKFLHESEPDPIARVVHLARKNIGQPYEIYLLGEFPYELYDPDPMYCLEKSDCVTFVENTYAMALSHDWPSFFRTLQRLRYKDGKVGMLTRNHESVADWDPNNAWLFEEITAKLGDGKAAVPMHLTWRPSKFFAKWNIGQDLPDVTVESVYIPRDRISSILSDLKDGDVVHIVRGNEKEQYVGHFGLVARGAGGEVNMVHSAEPAVREQGILNFLEKNPNTLGLKFLRPRPQPQELVDAQVK
jgi:hypothetical protein